MNNKDITQKQLEDYADIFADIVNVLMCGGIERVKPEELVEALPRSIYKADGKIHEQERDVAKYWQIGGVTISLLGIENQSKTERVMPIRCFSYDGASYREQLNVRDDAVRNSKSAPALYPAITIVLYFGDGHWNQPKSLKEILDIPEGFAPYVDDYHITVFEIQNLSDETVGAFKSDFRYVAEYFTQQRKLREGTILEISLTPRELYHTKEILELMYVMTGDHRFEDVYNEQVKGGNVNMFTLFDAAEKKGVQQGIEQGIQQGIDIGTFRTLNHLLKSGSITQKQAAEEAGMTLSEFDAALAEYRKKHPEG